MLQPACSLQPARSLVRRLQPLPLEHRLVQEAVRWITPLRLDRRLAPRRLGVLKVDGGGVRVGVRVRYPYPYLYP